MESHSGVGFVLLFWFIRKDVCDVLQIMDLWAKLLQIKHNWALWQSTAWCPTQPHLIQIGFAVVDLLLISSILRWIRLRRDSIGNVFLVGRHTLIGCCLTPSVNSFGPCWTAINGGRSSGPLLWASVANFCDKWSIWRWWINISVFVFQLLSLFFIFLFF